MKKKNGGNVRRNVLLFAIVAVLIVALGAVGTFLCKFNTSDMTIAEGNKAFASQQYDAALGKYAVAQNSAPIFAEPFYNAANVLYKQNKFEDAQNLLEQALTRSNEKIAEFIQFNLGNISFNAKQFEQAIARYEDALRLNPEDNEAKYNLELALLQKQQQDQQQQQNQEQEQNQDKQNQNQQNENQQSQDSQNQDGQQNQAQQNQQSGQQQQQQGQSQNQQGQQKENSQNQQNGQPQQQQQGQPKNAQQQNGQQDQTGQPSQQGSSTAGQPTNEQGNKQGYAYVPGELTQEQAEQLLAALGGNSQTLMEKLQQYLYVPGGEPDKDW